MGGIFDAVHNNVTLSEQGREEINQIFTEDSKVKTLQNLVDTYRKQAEQEKADREQAETEFKYQLAQATNMFNRRAEIIRQDAQKDTEKVISDILEPIDDLERVILYLTDKLSMEELTGLTHVYKKLVSALRKNDCEKVDTENGFNPDIHEALSTVPGEEAGHVAEVYQNGYTYKGKLIRPAKVVVTTK